MAGTVDVAKLLWTLLDGRFPDVTWVVGGPDVDAADKLPMGVLTPQTGTRVANGAATLGQTWQVPITLLDTSQTGLIARTIAVHDAMHDFHESGASVPGVGWVSYVDDVSMFSPAPQTTISADNIRQYDAVYTVIVRK